MGEIHLLTMASFYVQDCGEASSDSRLSFCGGSGVGSQSRKWKWKWEIGDCDDATSTCIMYAVGIDKLRGAEPDLRLDRVSVPAADG